MMITKLTAQEIWGEFDQGRSYKASIKLYENYRNNENFYVGKQWEGLNAPDMEKPVINVLKRVVSYFIAMIVSDDVAVSFTPFETDRQQELVAKILAKEVEKTIERGKMKSAHRMSVRNAAIDGDACIHFYFDPDASEDGYIKAEVIENIDVYPANTQSADMQNQPHIIFATYHPLEAVQEMAKKYGVPKDEISAIVPDKTQNVMYSNYSGTDSELVTVLTKYWREEGTVWCQVSTANVILRKAWDTRYTYYPVDYFSWEIVKDSCHGAAAITGLIPNQVTINRLFAYAIHHIKTMAFPQVIFDATKFDGKWPGGPGLSVGVNGPPNDAIATGFRVPDMSNQVLLTIDSLIDRTMQFMGASDAALGTVKPDNTSAIIATQKATAMPLEIQRMEYFRYVEDGIRIMVDIMKTDYGTRKLMVDSQYLMSPEDILALQTVGIDIPEQMAMSFDFGTLDTANMDMNIDIGSSTYWSELNQLQTMDNLFEKRIIQDPALYLEGIPDKYIKNKDKIIAALKKSSAMQPLGGVTPQAAVPIQSQ